VATNQRFSVRSMFVRSGSLYNKNIQTTMTTMKFATHTALLLSVLMLASDAFIPASRTFFVRHNVALMAKKKVSGKLAALEALEALEQNEASILQEPLSKKEQMKLEKKEEAAKDGADPEKPKTASAKEEKLARALAMEEADPANPSGDDEEPQQPELSKKELNALAKKEAKMTEKLAKKQAKKQAKEEDAPVEVTVEATNGEVTQEVRCSLVCVVDGREWYVLGAATDVLCYIYV
jgi:hypothetical protein